MDLIDRQDAIRIVDSIDTWQAGWRGNAIESLKAMPPVQPEHKTGQWICSDDMYETAVCSVCKWDTAEPWGHIKLWFKFCPRCGAKMEGG